MTRKLPPWAFALIYTALSMGAEIILIVVFRLQVPHDNAIIAPIILILPPLEAAWVARYRSLRELGILAALAALLTLVVTLTVTHFTKVNIGLLQPLILRPVAAFLAAIIANRLITRVPNAPPAV